MKRFAALVLLVLCFLPEISFARINVLELWYPGQDSSVGAPYSCTIGQSLSSGEHFWDTSAVFYYVTSLNIEVGGRWGIMSHSGNIGINDLMLAGKYQFVQENGQNPSVIGEAAFSLPTGKFSDGLGSGSLDFLLHWAAEKKISRYTGTFGIGMRLNSENSDKFSAGNVFFYHIGLTRPMDKDMTTYAELKGSTHGNSKLNGVELNDDFKELYLAPGIDYALDSKWRVKFALLIGLTSQSSDLGFLLSTFF